MYEFVKEKQEVQIARNQTLYTGKKNTFQDGDHVWIYISKKVVGKPDELTDSWTGPWKIHKVVNDVLVQVKPALFEGKARTIHVTRVRNYYEPKDIKSHQIPENLDETDDVDDGDELAEDLHPGEQIREPRDLLLPVEAPMPIEEIKDIPFKRPNLPQQEVPTITPMQAQEEHSLNLSNEEDASHMDSSSPSENETTDINMPEIEPITHQPESQETNSPKGGTKRKHAGTPLRSQASRRTRMETVLFKRPITPPPNPKQPKNLKKSESKTSLMKEAKKLVSTILPTTSDSEDNEKPGCSKIGGRPKKIEVDAKFEKGGYEYSTNSSDSDDTIGIQTIKQECDQSTEQPIFIRASRNTRVVPNSDISIPCQVKTNVPVNSFLTFSECPTLVAKGLILRPAIIPALDKEEFYLKALTTSKQFEIKKGQRIGIAFICKQL